MGDEQQRTVTLATLGAFDLGPGGRVSLLIYHRDGVEAVPLAKGQSVVVGRGDPARVQIPHPSLSRQHARFELVEGAVWVEDLGSTNGTRVGGEPLTARCRVEPGEEVTLGAATVVIHAAPLTDRHPGGLLEHDSFLSMLEQEMVRHRLFGHTLGLALVRSGTRDRGAMDSWLPWLLELLGPVDRAGLYGPTAVEILVPEATERSLRELAGTITGAAHGLTCGLSLFPGAAASPEELIEVTRTTALQATTRQPVQLAATSTEPVARGPVVVESAAMKKVHAAVDRLARASIPVLVVGETGTGKEVIARMIHEQSPRANGPLRCVNCAAMPVQLIESILFGHEKGAFTGADQQTNGVFQDADGGAVLLDEIGELSPPAQAALLRALETGRVARVGSTEEVAVDVRVLAATHRDLEAMCKAGEFRWDLLYRIDVMTLKIPPLRERAEEIEALALCFLEQANRDNGRRIEAIDPDALALLRSYPWPGNVRELRNAIHRAAVMADGETITVEDLPRRVLDWQPSGPEPEQLPAVEPQGDGEELDYRDRVERFERRLIEAALARTYGNQSDAARLLRIPIRTLSFKIKAFGISVESQ